MTVRSLVSRGLVLSLGWLLIAAAAPNQSGPPDTSLDATLSALRAYLDQSRKDLAVVIADEESFQRINRQVPPVPEMPRTRTSSGEVHFRFVDGNSAWMAIREIKSIDGAPINRGVSLAAALRSEDTALVALDFKAFNSRFNIGRVVRTFNEPTLVQGQMPRVASYWSIGTERAIAATNARRSAGPLSAASCTRARSSPSYACATTLRKPAARTRVSASAASMIAAACRRRNASA
jgi:hypothetical protein